MKKTMLISILFLFASITSHAQNDTINQQDENGLKQGYWIIYGIDKPQLEYPDSAMVYDGRYVDNKKQGVWTSYDKNGRVKLRGEFNHGRPKGSFTTGVYPVKIDSSSIYDCAKKDYDSICVKLNDSYSYKPSIDTFLVFQRDLSPQSSYLDSLSRLSEEVQSPNALFCSHILDIRIYKFYKGKKCEVRYTTCHLKSEEAEVARECAKRIFNYKR